MGESNPSQNRVHPWPEFVFEYKYSNDLTATYQQLSAIGSLYDDEVLLYFYTLYA